MGTYRGIRRPAATAKARTGKTDNIVGRAESEMSLRSLRESLGKTQDELARLAAVTQSQLSKIERRDDHLMSTLRRYVRALGGDITVVAVVGDKRVTLRNV